MVGIKGDGDILDLLSQAEAEFARRARRGLIIQPGALGDCVLTLPLAKFIKESVDLGGVDVLGHTDYTGIFPGRTVVDSVRSIDLVDLHRLFSDAESFDLSDRDPLIHIFEGYDWIVTFLGEPGSDFEQNLIYAVNCSHGAEVVTIELKPDKDFGGHISDFYIQQFIDQCGMFLEFGSKSPCECVINFAEADIKRGRQLLSEAHLDVMERLFVIQPGSGGKEKSWCLDNFISVGKKLAGEGFEVLFLLGPAEQEKLSSAAMEEIADKFECFAGLSLADVLAVFGCAAGFVGNDSGITHVAAGCGLKTAAVFGPTDSNIYRPLGPDVSVFADKAGAFNTKQSDELQSNIVGFLTA